MEGLTKKTIVFTIIAVVLYLILFFFLDKPIDLWVDYNYSKTWHHDLGVIISYFAYDPFIRIGLTFGFILIFISDPGIKKRWTRTLLFICLSVSIAIVIGDGFKYLFARYRPVMLFDNNLYGLHFFSTEWAMNSTPSGHTLRAFSLLTALTLLYRKYAVLFISVAILIGLCRVVVTAHYPSDVLFGAFIGIISAVWTYKYIILKTSNSKEEIS